ncbi:TPA: hypothetical protein ACMDRZ_003528 [Vibrio cholerae]|uniref:hypothetical protein n=1 Tax=Vibrio cholerae TaxID=666 RepID=UPI0011D828AE|nr:hypothetical protein [Vibrio cholerae]QKU64099.1 hypothetical protein HPY17_12595 [Vibrio cholerae]QKU67982.1 hypothetical protein HPY10_12635 [Vibrio cholerae]TXX50712.1 hypothetical protein FXF14_04630 [Vibrio cholerae]
MNYNLMHFIKHIGLFALFTLIVLLNEINFFNDNSTSLIMLTMMVFLVIYFTSNSFLDFGFFALLMTPYMAINIAYMLSEDMSHFDFSIAVCLGMTMFFVIYNHMKVKNSNNYVLFFMGKKLKEINAFSVYFVVFLLLLVLKVMSLSPSFDVLYKAIKLMIGNILLIFFYALFFAISTCSKSRVLIFLSLLLLFFFTVINNLTVASVSRFAFLQVFIILIICFYARYRRDLRVNKGLFLFLFVLTSYVCFLLFDFRLRFGGDSLIFKGATEVILHINETGEYEPLMPFFNGGGILIPESVWSLFAEKPRGFNSSAYYIDKVMGIDPKYYPWGVGISSFGAGYIYGGYLGVALLFSALALIFAKINNEVTDPFSAGVVIYLNVLLVFTIVRMDETFIFGTWLISLPILFFFIRKSKGLFYE